MSRPSVLSPSLLASLPLPSHSLRHLPWQGEARERLKCARAQTHLRGEVESSGSPGAGAGPDRWGRRGSDVRLLASSPGAETAFAGSPEVTAGGWAFQGGAGAGLENRPWHSTCGVPGCLEWVLGSGRSWPSSDITENQCHLLSRAFIPAFVCFFPLGSGQVPLSAGGPTFCVFEVARQQAEDPSASHAAVALHPSCGG